MPAAPGCRGRTLSSADRSCAANTPSLLLPSTEQAPTMESVDALFAACRAGDVAAVQRILAAAPQAAMATEFGGRLPLHMAAWQGNAMVAHLLLEAAPAAAMTADSWAFMPLHLAAHRGHAEIVQLLLEAAPAAVLAVSKYGFVPPHLAATHGHEAVVRLLLGVAPHAAMSASRNGQLPLHIAASSGHEPLVRVLLEAAPAAATARTAAPANETPLELALARNRASASRALLGAGPPQFVLAALAAHNPDHSLFVDFLLTPGRLPLDAAHWALVPVPCTGIGSALPTALACSPAQAAQVVRRLSPADTARLRTAALCLGRCSLPAPVPGHILARLFC